MYIFTSRRKTLCRTEESRRCQDHLQQVLPRWGQAALQYLQGWRSSPALEDSGGPCWSLMVPIWAEDHGLLSQSGLICLFVCYSPSSFNVIRYKQSSEHRSKSRSCTHCAGVHNQWAKDLLSHLSVFILTIRVRQWWKADSLTPCFEFRYLRFIRRSGFVCTNVINCPCSLRPMISVCRLASLEIQSGWWRLLGDQSGSRCRWEQF